MARSIAVLTLSKKPKKLAFVRRDPDNLRAYAQSVAAQTTASDADAILESSGVAIRKATRNDKPALTVKQRSGSGTVHIAATSAGKRAAYTWPYSTDQETWTSVPETIQAKTGVSGLTAGTTYPFRVQSVTKGGLGDTSPIVSRMVT